MKLWKHHISLLITLILFFSSCGTKVPRIQEIDPRIGNLGEILTIQGTNFGESRDESFVSIAGIIPTASSYLEWSNNQIVVRVPEFGDSGLVYVHSRGKKSNAALFSNQASIPKPISGTGFDDGPHILSVDPVSGKIGSILTIQGRNFGVSRDYGSVLFAWAAENPPSAPASAHVPGTVEVSEHEFGYELWSDREIRIRIPDGAISGNVEVHSRGGISPAVFFEVTGKPGNKTYKDKRSYAISYSVDVKVQQAEGTNTLYLWIPLPQNTVYQRVVQRLSRSMEPFVENHKGTALFQFKDLSETSSVGVSVAYLVDVYAVETQIRAQSIKREATSPIYAAYTPPTPLIPSNDTAVKELTNRIIGREKNVYLQARKIYDWLVSQGGIGIDTPEGGAKEALESGMADAYSASLLFCAMARSVGIPALPVSGFLIDRSRKATEHFWVEFWIDGFGWVPVDPALGAGIAPESFTLREDAQTYYFGNIDNQRIAFSRGQTSVTQMDPRGRITQRTRKYSLQTLWEEAVGGLESYSSLWSDLVVTGIY